MEVVLNLEILGGPLTIVVNEDKSNLIYSYKTRESDISSSITLCLEEKEYGIDFTTSSINTISYSIKLGNVNLKTMELVTFSNIHKTTLAPSLSRTPSISLENRQLFLGVTYNLYPLISGKGCSSFIQDDSNYLPKSMTFNSANGGITGKLNEKFVKGFTIKCVDGSNTIPATVSYLVKECPAYYILYELKIESKANGNNIVALLESPHKVIYNIKGVSNEKVYILSDCILYSSFKLTLSSRDGAKWSIGTKVTLTYNGESREFSFTGTSLVITESNFTKASSDPKWMYSDKFEDNWSNTFDKSSWKRSELSKLPKVSVITRYYRLIYNLMNDYEILDTLQAVMTFEGGMVLYVNGVEISRKDLSLKYGSETEPDNDGVKDDYQYEISGNLLRSGINYIGVEIHRNIEAGGKLDNFRMQIRPLSTIENCVPKTLFYSMNPSMEVINNTDGVVEPNAYDLDYSTEFIGNASSSDIKSAIIFQFPVNIHKAFNSYSIVTVKDCPNRDLVSWIISGSYLGKESYDELDTILNGNIEGDPNSNPGLGRNKVNSYKLKNVSKNYEWYIIEMNSIKSLTNTINKACDRKYGFAEFYVSNCRELACEGTEGYLSTRVETKSYKSCDNGKIGRKERLCELENGIPTWRQEAIHCDDISQIIEYNSDTLSFKVGLYTDDHEANSVNSQRGYFEVVGKLPAGITIDEVNGTISGTATEVVAKTAIYVKYDFLSGNNLISSKINVMTECKISIIF